MKLIKVFAEFLKYCAVAMGGFSLAAPVQGAEFSVGNGDVAGLVAAIQQASSTPEPDTIVLALNGNYTLFDASLDNSNGLTGLPLIRGEVHILGNGSVLQRGFTAPRFRLLQVARNAHLKINGLTLNNGYARYRENGPYGDGGAIYAEGELTIVDSRFTANTGRIGGAISARTNVTIDLSSFQGNIARGISKATGSAGGALSWTEPAIQPAPKLRISRSLFELNKTVQYSAESAPGFAGALRLAFPGAEIDSSTFAFNASNTGGAIVAFYDLSVENSTFVFNSALGTGGAISASSDVNEDSLTLTHSTFVGNLAQDGGGGVRMTGARNWLSNNLFVSNSRDECTVDFGILVTNAGNWISDGSCQAVFSGNPRLASFGDHGGPTPTHSLANNSPAIGAAEASACLSRDQRGLPRSGGSSCDIGAFEQTLKFVSRVPVVTKPDPFLVVCDPLSSILELTLLGSQRFAAKEALPTSITLGAMKAGVSDPKGIQLGDVNKDGELDLVLRIPATDAYQGLACESTTVLEFKGLMHDGTELFGNMLVHPQVRK